MTEKLKIPGSIVFLVAAVSIALAVATGADTAASSGPWTESSDRSKVSRVWAVGDVGEGALGEPTSELVASLPMRYLIYLGDVYPDGTAADFTDNYAPTFGQFDQRAVPTMGNHEYPNRAIGFDPYWGSARGSAPPRYFAFKASGWQFIVLNSEMATGVGSAQHTWLKNLIANTRSRGNCRIAITHRPRYSGGSHGDNTSIEPLWSLLANKARVWLSGHDHNMQRFSANRGIAQFVSGAGGRSHYPLDDPSGANLVFSNATDDGALRLTLSRRDERRSKLWWAFKSAEDGSQLASGNLGCYRSR